MNAGHGCAVRVTACWVVALCVCAGAASVSAQSPPAPPPAPQGHSAGTASPADGADFDNTLGIPDAGAMFKPATDAKGVSTSLQILVLLTVLTLVPSILAMMTAFPRIIIVLALLRQALGTQQLPPGQILLGLSLFLTMLVMAPTWNKIHADAVTPYFDSKMGQEEAIDVTLGHLKNFMYRQIDQADNHEDVYLFMEYSRGAPIPDDEEIELESVSMTAMIPAFILSELKTAFIMGFRIYLPFLVIDMVIAMILISMGMMMLPPVLISLPFKIMLFVLADGWHLVVETLLYSFATGGAGP